MPLWNLIRSRTMNNDICTRTVIRDDMKALGLDVKNFSRWVTKLETEGLLTVDGEMMTLMTRRQCEE